MPETGDKWFSNWSRKQQTELVVQAHRAYKETGELKEYTYSDWRPDWAHEIKVAECVNLGSAYAHRKLKKQTFGDKLRNIWNDLKAPRNPNIYFDGILECVNPEETIKDLIYRYKPWQPEEK